MTMTAGPIPAADFPRYDVTQASTRLGVSAATLRRLVREGKIACYRPSPRMTRFSDRQLEEFLASVEKPVDSYDRKVREIADAATTIDLSAVRQVPE